MREGHEGRTAARHGPARLPTPPGTLSRLPSGETPGIPAASGPGGACRGRQGSPQRGGRFKAGGRQQMAPAPAPPRSTSRRRKARERRSPHAPRGRPCLGWRRWRRWWRLWWRCPAAAPRDSAAHLATLPGRGWSGAVRARLGVLRGAPRGCVGSACGVPALPTSLRSLYIKGSARSSSEASSEGATGTRRRGPARVPRCRRGLAAGRALRSGGGSRPLGSRDKSRAATEGGLPAAVRLPGNEGSSLHLPIFCAAIYRNELNLRGAARALGTRQPLWERV